MPLVVDPQKIRMEILHAFEACLSDKPLPKITLRDIAEKAGMSHTKLLHYFSTRDDIVHAYCEYTRNYMTDHCIAWFESHNRKDYQSDLDFLNDFLSYVANGKEGEMRPVGTVQTYVFAKYDETTDRLVRQEFANWREAMEKCLKKVYGDRAGAEQAEVMMILIAGTFLCNYNHALTGRVNQNIAGAFLPLLVSQKD